ncbi:MAG: hypothetical protein KIT14_05840 [bacterium]|nr:hypothetical protein [bacterium]
MTVDERDWPLVRVTLDGPVGVLEALRYHDDVARWCGRAERFALLHDRRRAVHRHDPAVVRLESAQIRARRAQMADRCVGLAAVVPPALAARLDGSGAVALRARFGCPSAVFATLPEAEAWLRARLAAG